MTTTPVKAWICSVCGYIHYGDEPPAECPSCGADREFFEPYAVEAEPLPEPAGSVSSRRYVIVGAGIAGVSAAEAIRKADPAGDIRIVYSEPGLPYYRMNLTRYLAGEITGSELDLHPRDWYQQNRIELSDGLEVTALDLTGKALVTPVESIPYDMLVLACGAQPFTPPIPGTGIHNVTTLRTRSDADRILAVCSAKAASGAAPQVVCIGGGILGLETAGALACRGAQVTVLESLPWLLPRQLNSQAARIFQAYLGGLGIQVVTQARIREIIGTGEGTDCRVYGVALDGEREIIPADLVVISAGVRANLQLARSAGLAVKNGLIVDEHMRTSAPDVFAAGDLAEFQGVLYGLWSPAQMQGTVAGSHAGGRAAYFKTVPPSSTLKVLGIDLFSIGAVNDPGAHLVDRQAERAYTGYLFTGGIMTGAILLGDARQAARVKRAIEDKVDFSDLLSKNSAAGAVEEALN